MGSGGAVNGAVRAARTLQGCRNGHQGPRTGRGRQSCPEKPVAETKKPPAEMFRRGLSAVSWWAPEEGASQPFLTKRSDASGRELSLSMERRSIR